MSRGLSWLQSQVQANGSLAGEVSSVATTLQNRSEAGQALAALATLPSNLADAIASEADGNTEYLARQAIALIAAGRDASAQINLLLQRRNSDRGFGGGPGFESNPLDSAWVVLALARAGQGAGTPARDARAYLMASLQSDGGVAAADDPTRIEYSAAALFALQTAGDGSTATTVRALAAWLLQRQGADGSWQGNVYLTAFSAIAVVPAVSDQTVRATASSFLLARQSAAGAWQDDPFLTALALRALIAGSGSASPAAATLTGQVIDQGTNLPLAGTTIALSGAGSAGAVTDNEGRFSIGSLTAGTYSAQVARAGYGAASLSVSIFAGQTLDAGRIALAQIATAGIVRGRVTAATGGAALAGVSVSVTGSATLSATTDASGSFEFPGVAPGGIVISASIAGFQSATGSATITGGQTLVFSPALYRTAEATPTTGRLIGRTVVAGTNAPLAGVSIVLNGAAAGSSASDGHFDLTLNPESYVAVYNLSGYSSVSQGFLLAAGTTVDAGNVALPAQRTTTTISGNITESTGLPLADAIVQLLGGASVTTGPDGAYSFSGLRGTSFDLRASATGYASQLVTLQVSSPSEVVYNFALTSGSTSLAIGDLNVSPANPGANAEVSVSTSITNIGSTDASALLLMQVIDVDGAGGAPGTVIGSGIAYDTSGNLLGIVQLRPGEAQSVRVAWNTGRFPPGRYALVLRLVAPGSLTAATPQGSLLLEKRTSVDVAARTHFAGSATANPPVLRAGTNTAVKLSALIQNDGNSLLPAQPYTLTVINAQTGAPAHSQTVNGQPLAVSELAELAFDDWTPSAGGNFRVEIISSDPAEGKLATSLYVGDSGTAQYTTNKLVVPAGTQTVRANVRVTGQDVADGTISDPLAAPIRAAIQKAVTFADTFGASHYVNDLKCYACHVESQSVLGGEFNRKLTTFDAKNRNTLLNGITTQQNQDGSWFSSDFTTATMLGLWALTGWHDRDQFNWTKSRAVDHVLATQSGNGSWNWTHPFAWWRSNVSLTGINAKSLVDYRKYLATGPAPTAVPRYSVVDWPRGAAVTGVAIALNEGPDGALYASRFNEARVDRILANGTLQLVHSGLNVRDSIVTADGTLYMSAEQGVFRKSPSGTLAQLTNKRSAGLALGPDGTVYFAAYAEAAVFKIVPNGTPVRMVPSAPLTTPHSVALDDDGSLVVADFGRNFIYRFLPDGTFTRLAEIFTAPFVPGPQPYKVQRWGDKWLVTGEGALYIFNRDWQGERVTYEKSYGALMTVDGELLFGGNGRIKRLQIGADTLPARIAAMDLSIDRATNWLLLDSSLDANDNIQLATRMIGLGSVLEHYQGTAKEASVRTKLEQVGATLRARQRTNGGWTWFGTTGTIDSLVTAMAGVALDYLNPSPQSAEVRNAVNLLLSRQRADGTWFSEAGVASPPLLTTTWVEIWLPTMLARLGGIDTDLSVTFPANVTLTNPDKAPTSSISNPDATKTYVWKLVGVTADGQAINYDLTLADLAVNEVRRVSTDAHLTFKNSFTGGTVDAPIDIPRVAASAFLELGLTTDRTTYGANTPVNITGQVTNTDGGLLGGSVKFEVFAADSNLVTTVGTLPFTGVAAGASANLMPVWNTDGTLVGAGYYVLATLYDSVGALVGTARSNFNIVADTSTLVSGRVTADKLAYLPAETARITSRVTNLTENQPLDGLTAVTTVTNPEGTVRFTQSEQIAQLAQSALKDFSYAVPLGFAPAGSYAASLSVRDALGAVLASSSTSFTVGSSAVSGSGLTGALSATPKPVPFGDPVAFTAAVNNLGNADIPALEVKIAVVDPAAQRVLAEFPATLVLARGQTAPLSFGWPASAAVGGTYVAVLTATLGTATLTLAQEAFTIAPPVTRVAGTLAAIPKQVPQGEAVVLSASVTNTGFGAITGLPLTVTVANSATQQVVAQFSDIANIALSGAYQKAFSWPATGAVGTSYTATLRATVNGATQTLAQDSFSIIAPPVQLDVTLASLKQARVLVLLSCTLGADGLPRGQADRDACVAQRGAFLASYLSGLGMNHRITITEAEFQLAFRSGQYNTYWITGGSLKLANTLTEEVREAVYRGDALILDDVHDERNHGLDAPAGVDLQGKLAVVDQSVSVTGPLFATGTLASLGRPLKLVITTGQAQAVFPASANGPAIVSNQYGQGRGLVFAYDLVGTLMVQAPPALTELVQAGIAWVAPEPAAVSMARAYTVLRGRVTNLGIGAELKATFTAPAGASVLGTAPAAVPDASGRPVWSFALDSGAMKNLDVGLRLPATTGSFSASLSIDLSTGLPSPFSSFATLAVESTETVAPRVASELSALAVASNDKLDRNAAVSNILAAQASIAAGAYEQALGQLLTAAERLVKIASVDVSAQRVEVARMMQEAQVRWFLAQPQ